MHQLTEGQIAAIKANPNVRHLAFDWASAMCERHVDHAGDWSADLWGIVNEVLDIDTASNKTVSVTPMLVHADFNDEFVEDPLATGRTDYQCYSITECIVYIMLDDTKQVIELDPINISEV